MLFSEIHNDKQSKFIPVYSKEFDELVNIIIDELLNNDTIKQLILSFIENTNRWHYLDHRCIAYIERNYFYTHSTLKYKPMLTIDEYKLDCWMSIEYHINETITPFATNDIDKLSKLLIRKYNLTDSVESLYALYLAIMQLSRKYFTEVAQAEIGIYFKGIKCNDIGNYLDVFCNIESLDTNDKCIRNLFALYLMQNNVLSYNKYYTDCFFEIQKLVDEKKEEISILSYEKKLLQPKSKITYSINDIDLMDGGEFERFLALLFNNMGYVTTITKGSGDQGIDVIAEKNSIKIGVQAKCYSGSVGNSAIQEVVAGGKHYSCDKCIVVTNNVFSKSAIELAQTNNVILWDRTMLKEKIAEVFC